jgi:hypothetical protein
MKLNPEDLAKITPNQLGLPSLSSRGLPEVLAAISFKFAAMRNTAVWWFPQANTDRREQRIRQPRADKAVHTSLTGRSYGVR